jgi:hypothetical protein
MLIRCCATLSFHTVCRWTGARNRVLFIRKTWRWPRLLPRPVNCYVNVKPLEIEGCCFWFLILLWFFFSASQIIGTVVVGAVEVVGNSERFGRRVFPNFHSPVFVPGLVGQRGLVFP